MVLHWLLPRRARGPGPADLASLASRAAVTASGAYIPPTRHRRRLVMNGEHRTAVVLFGIALAIAIAIASVTTLERTDTRVATNGRRLA